MITTYTGLHSYSRRTTSESLRVFGLRPLVRFNKGSECVGTQESPTPDGLTPFFPANYRGVGPCVWDNYRMQLACSGEVGIMSAARCPVLIHANGRGRPA